MGIGESIYRQRPHLCDVLLSSVGVIQHDDVGIVEERRRIEEAAIRCYGYTLAIDVLSSGILIISRLRTRKGMHLDSVFFTGLLGDLVDELPCWAKKYDTFLEFQTTPFRQDNTGKGLPTAGGELKRNICLIKCLLLIFPPKVRLVGQGARDFFSFGVSSSSSTCPLCPRKRQNAASMSSSTARCTRPASTKPANTGRNVF